jgi:hypothetical protein
MTVEALEVLEDQDGMTVEALEVLEDQGGITVEVLEAMEDQAGFSSARQAALSQIPNDSIRRSSIDLSISDCQIINARFVHSPLAAERSIIVAAIVTTPTTSQRT